MIEQVEEEVGEEKEEDLIDYAKQYKKKHIELFDWQKRAIEFFDKSEGQAIYVCSTGSGKTSLAIQIIKNVMAKDDVYILIVVPKNVILETGWYKELTEAGIPLQDIGVYYGNIKEYGRITLTNMQNLENIEWYRFNFFIYDELHNFVSRRLIDFVKRKAKYKIGLSATIDKADGSHWHLLEHFNFNRFDYSPKDALEDGVLNAFDFFNIGVQLDADTRQLYNNVTEELNMLFRQYGSFARIMKGSEEIRNAMLKKITERKMIVNNFHEKFNIVKLICGNHPDDKTLVFNQFNDQTNKCYWHLLDAGINARIIHSGVEREKRDQILMDFKNDKFNVLLTSKVLDEGYNLPVITAGILMASDGTSRQTIQRMGRILRKKEKKSKLYQIYCIDTIEDKAALSKARIFKELSDEFFDLIYENDGLRVKA